MLYVDLCVMMTVFVFFSLIKGTVNWEKLMLSSLRDK